MKPESGAFLAKAVQSLAKARTNLAVEVYDVAGRLGYVAAFHANQAFIFERTGRVAKTHRGVRALLSKLAMDEPRIDSELVQFLGHGFQLKQVADYATGDAAIVSAERASAAIEIATRFVTTVESILAGSPA